MMNSMWENKTRQFSEVTTTLVFGLWLIDEHPISSKPGIYLANRQPSPNLYFPLKQQYEVIKFTIF